LHGKDGEAGDIGFIVDGAGCSQAEEGPLEARSSFQTEPYNLGHVKPTIIQDGRQISKSGDGVCQVLGGGLPPNTQHLTPTIHPFAKKSPLDCTRPID